ncbi:MAG: ABC transporter ATP-binding protein [Proteobacteria bacterium]|nr:ABC transporter ATP-binding protein [Pseudomonadota bacterium]MBU1452571.1 ABC transporter ATP-binding protein [Pseudomonadota bacterium]MBU2469242.1 ABC transporter ATP-binding protein [Pseudomonadota bacterium]MBU2517036.1 ABC transporter ATP-binding protein [Pseudomonadota bacterium]
MLEVKDVVKAFDKSLVINGVSFSIAENEVVALLGPNGAGKTTMVNLISGHLQPTSGKILLNGEDITNASPYQRIKKGIARNFQITHLFEDLSVLDNVRTCVLSNRNQLGRFFKPASGYKEATEEARAILGIFNLEQFSDQPGSELSEGDKKVLDTAMTFALKPDFLLLDEPTSGVATADKFKVMDTIIDAIGKRGTATLIIEHDMDIVSDYCQRVLVLAEGTILARGTPQEVMDDPRAQETLFGVSE